MFYEFCNSSLVQNYMLVRLILLRVIAIFCFVFVCFGQCLLHSPKFSDALVQELRNYSKFFSGYGSHNTMYDAWISVTEKAYQEKSWFGSYFKSSNRYKSFRPHGVHSRMAKLNPLYVCMFRFCTVLSFVFFLIIYNKTINNNT